MAIRPAISLKIDTNIEPTQKYIRGLIKNVPLNLIDSLEESLYDLRELMRQTIRTKIKPAADYPGKSIFDDNAIMISRINEDDKSANLRLRVRTPHAKFLENGVKPHYVPNPLSPDFKKSETSISSDGIEKLKVFFKAINHVDEKGIQLPFIHVGGSGSRIAKGQSKYSFFNESIDQFLSTNILDKKVSKKLDLTLKTGGRK